MTNHAARLTQTPTPPRLSQFTTGGDRANNFPRGPAAWKIIQRAAFGAGLLLVALALLGCDSGPKLVKAGGTVKYKDKPIPGADIIMMSDASSSPSLARTDDQGRFTVSTDGKPGALVGSYRVAITAARNKREVSPGEALSMTSEQIAANREDVVPIKYNNFESSGLTATISDEPAKNEFSFELK